MRKLTISKVTLFFSLFVGMAMLPNYASARGSISIQLPGISIGVNDRYQQRYYDRRTRSYRYATPGRIQTYRSYSYPSYRSNSYRYPTSRRIYQPSYQSSICPTPGYSEYYYEGHGCYQHKDHYHCD